MGLISILYFIGFILITGVRTYFSIKNKPPKGLDVQFPLVERLFLGLTGVGMIIPLVYLAKDWFSFADYPRIPVLQWIGLAVFFFSSWVLYRSHADLGKNWTPEVAIQEGQSLITSGIFKHMRHPMYASHLYWGIAQVLIFPNWIVGPFLLIAVILLLSQRIGREEAMMMEQFGEEYESYKKRTGRFLPKIN